MRGDVRHSVHDHIYDRNSHDDIRNFHNSYPDGHDDVCIFYNWHNNDLQAKAVQQ